MDSSRKKIRTVYKCITANSSATWQHAAHTTNQLPSHGHLTGIIQNSLSPNEKFRENFIGHKKGIGNKRYTGERTNKAEI